MRQIALHRRDRRPRVVDHCPRLTTSHRHHHTLDSHHCPHTVPQHSAGDQPMYNPARPPRRRPSQHRSRERVPHDPDSPRRRRRQHRQPGSREASTTSPNASSTSHSAWSTSDATESATSSRPTNPTGHYSTRSNPQTRRTDLDRGLSGSGSSEGGSDARYVFVEVPRDGACPGPAPVGPSATSLRG
jgi:hypothetical protein